MDAHSEIIFQEYLDNLPAFKKIQEIIIDKLNGIVHNLDMTVNTVESRVKTEKSLKGKLELKGYKYKSLADITDIVGGRVVTFYSGEVDKIAAEIEKLFDIDFDNSIDKRSIYNVDQFGYMSLHYICSIPKELYFDENMPQVNEYKFEVQIRTTLQHTWASIYHDTGYKNDIEVPKEYLRGLNRLAGLLELADKEFEEIRSSLSDYRRRIKSVVKSGSFKDIELNGDTFREYLEIEPFASLNQRIAEVNNMEIEKLNLYPFLEVFKTLKFETLEDIHEVIKEDSEDAYQMAVRQFTGTDLDIMSNFTGPLCLCFVCVIKAGAGEYGIIKTLEGIYGNRPSNERYAKKIAEIARNMGLLK